ncbi:MAG: hypothetical protein PWP23_2653, partial [Candidatus Sumerlaeota bacterium]|nr:hypothetical protein [Candidatus Sumerlaeota bacterium]
MVEDLYWDAAGNLAAVEQFIGSQVIEERRGTDDSVLASYVHGAYIDDVVTMRRAVPQGGIP